MYIYIYMLSDVQNIFIYFDILCLFSETKEGPKLSRCGVFTIPEIQKYVTCKIMTS